MPWGVAAGVVGSVAGAAVSSAMAPSTSGGSGGGSYYTPTGLQSADQAWQQLFQNQIGAYNNNSNNLYGYGQQSLNQGLAANQQYGGAAQTGADLAGSQYGGNAVTNNGYGAIAAGQAMSNYGAQNYLQQQGQNVFNTAMDPQNALYGRTVQQLQDQTGATNSMYGLGASAAGAGVANQALSNFNIDWQNQQLGRQTQGLSALQGAYSTGGQYGQLGNSQLQGASGFLGQAATDYQNAGQTPYNTAQQLAGTPGQLSNAAQTNLQNTVYGPSQAITGQAIPYMNYGQGAQAVPYQNQMQGAGAAGSMVSQGIQGLGSAAQNGAFSNMFGGGSGQGYFGSTQSPGNYGGTGFGGFGMGSGGDYYSGGGNSYGFTTG